MDFTQLKKVSEFEDIAIEYLNEGMKSAAYDK